MGLIWAHTARQGHQAPKNHGRSAIGILALVLFSPAAFYARNRSGVSGENALSTEDHSAAEPQPKVEHRNGETATGRDGEKPAHVERVKD